MAYLKILDRVEILPTEDAPVELAITPSPPKVRQVLALLVLRANHVVSAETIVAELWDDSPPRSALTTVQTYIYHLRKFFDAEQIPGLGPERLQTRLPGYVLRCALDQLDAQRFLRLAADARRLHAAGQYEAAIVAADAALQLTEGETLANVRRGRLLDAHATHLEEERLSAVEVRIEAAFALGRHRAHISELRALVAMHPMHEWMHARLIEALIHADRRSDALAAYQHLRRVLDVELGLRPSAATQQLQQQALAA
ncbi:AfsR/SARP family transcriptional regulator [Microlunatus ginsengisoli]|uniref:AfsR/SARP family transcriptional regulator n=1 Tax=Microlunatus ginsengisoli TaxID=363863 RepID=A0ABP7AGM9_9ACTN